MPDQAFEALLRGPARRDYQQLNPSDQAVDLRLVALLEADPFIDGERKRDFGGEVAPLIVFIRDGWALIYRIVEGWVVDIWAIVRTDSAWWERNRHRVH